jgi:hypothetical protein
MVVNACGCVALSAGGREETVSNVPHLGYRDLRGNASRYNGYIEDAGAKLLIQLLFSPVQKWKKHTSKPDCIFKSGNQF